MYRLGKNFLATVLMWASLWFNIISGISRAYDDTMNACFRFRVIPGAAPIYLLGTEYYAATPETAGVTTDQFLADYRSIPYISYRSGFTSLTDENNNAYGITSDAGWGCAIRSGQMMAANALSSMRMGDNWREGPVDDQVVREVMPMFFDSPDAPFSIHKMIEIRNSSPQSPKWQPREWFRPSEALNSIVQSTKTHPQLAEGVGMFLTGDGMLVRDRAEQLFSQDGINGLVYFISVQLGVKDVDAKYRSEIINLFKRKSFLGFVGGEVLTRAFYFVGASEDYLYYLDPHFVRSAMTAIPDGPLESQPYVTRMRWSMLSPTMTLGFRVMSMEQYDSEILDVIKASPNLAGHLAIYDSEPSFNPDDVLSIDDEYDLVSSNELDDEHMAGEAAPPASDDEEEDFDGVLI